MVRDTTIGRISVLAVVLVLLDVGNVIGSNFSVERARFESQVQVMERERDAIARELVESEDAFRDKLTKIATALYERDYHSMGGYATSEGESLVVVYEAILNEVRDYRTLLLDLDNYFDARKRYVDSVPSVWPIEYNELTRITSGFGWRLSPVTGKVQYHGGVDMTGVWDSRVISTLGGEVVEHWPAPGIYGGVRFRGHPHLGGAIRIRHEGGIETIYGHMRTTFVNTGDRVERGDEIGIMGNTGVSTGIHLHYEVHVDGTPVDPIGFLRF